MGGMVAVLRLEEIDDSQGAGWDALCDSRGVYADIYSTAAWFRAWAGVADRDELDRTRVLVAYDGDQPLALLPLSRQRLGGWGSTGALRFRGGLVVAGERPQPEPLQQLAEEVARLGRGVTLRRLPTRDPATDVMMGALRQAGFRLSSRPVESDHVTPVTGWAEHSERFRGFARYAQRMVSRIQPLWDVSMQTFGTSADQPVGAGFDIYDQVQQRSWKGAMAPATRAHRAALLRNAERNGWARVFVLRIGGVPAAGHIWFRVGDVAVWLATAYDQRLASLSPGTVAQWWAQERMLADPLPRLVDLLPGGNEQKERLTEQRPPLVDLTAVRRLSVGVSRAAGWAGSAAAAARRRTRHRAPAAPAGRPQTVPVRTTGFAPETGTPPGGVAAIRLDPTTLRYLAVAGCHANVEAMTCRWQTGDQWVRLGDVPQQLLRLGRPGDAGRLVREVVHAGPPAPLADVVRRAAFGLGEQLWLHEPAPDGDGSGTPVEEHRSPLPWPAGLELLPQESSRAGH